MIETIQSAFKSGHGVAVVYGIGAGLIASDIIPTPADAAYFRLMAINKRKLENKEITPNQYWTRDAVLYYGLNPIWWALVVGAVVLTKGDVGKKAEIGIGLLAAGAVVGVLAKNIREEEQAKK